jgi:hypothetical protein
MRFILASRKGKAKHAWRKRSIVTADSASRQAGERAGFACLPICPTGAPG